MLDDRAGAAAHRTLDRERQAFDPLRQMRDIEILEPLRPQRFGLGECPKVRVRRVQPADLAFVLVAMVRFCRLGMSVSQSITADAYGDSRKPRRYAVAPGEQIVARRGDDAATLEVVRLGP